MGSTNYCDLFWQPFHKLFFCRYWRAIHFSLRVTWLCPLAIQNWIWHLPSPFSKVAHFRKHKVGFVSEWNVPQRVVVVCIFKRTLIRCVCFAWPSPSAVWSSQMWWAVRLCDHSVQQSVAIGIFLLSAAFQIAMLNFYVSADTDWIFTVCTRLKNWWLHWSTNFGWLSVMITWIHYLHVFWAAEYENKCNILWIALVFEIIALL